MAINKKIKNLRGRYDDSYIKAHYSVPYSMISNGRYKHIDELLLYDGKLIKATLSPIDLSTIPFDGSQLYLVTSAEKNRLDLIALKFYGSSDLWWVICYMNNISDPLNLPIGKSLIIPVLSGLRKFPNPLA
jgi:hypothetical protein